MKEELKIRNRLWICTDKGTFLGEGRINLLRAIGEHGSISKAAKSMNMSYKKAWELVNSMNGQSSKPLVESAIGGKEGGGSLLSETGKNAIIAFDRINDECNDFLNNRLKEIKF